MLKCRAEVTALAEVFDFAPRLPGTVEGGPDRGRDRAAGAWRARGPEPRPRCWSGWSAPGWGLEVVSKVNDIPKGSRLAVSTNLLAAIVTACMRATGQIESLDGPLDEPERRIVVGEPVFLRMLDRSELSLRRNIPGSRASGLSSSDNARIIAVTSAARTPWPVTSQIKTEASVSESAETLKKSPLTDSAGS